MADSRQEDSRRQRRQPSKSAAAVSSVGSSRGQSSRAAAGGSVDLSSMRRYFSELDKLPLAAVAEIVPVPEVTER